MRNTLLFLLLAGSLAGADWLTYAGNPQRTGWARGEEKITKENVAKLKLEWTRKLDNLPKELNALTVPLIAENVITNRGFKDVAIVAGSSDKVFALEAESGKLLWQRTLETQGEPKQKPHWLCPNCLNATPVLSKRPPTIYVIASDGKLHTLNVVNGEERQPPVQFVPPFSKNWSLNLVNNVLYTTVSQGCNGAKSGVYAMDLNDPQRGVSFFQASTAGAGIWGRGGAAITSGGMVVAETGDGPYDVAAGKLSDTFLGLSGKDLKLADYYTPSNRAWITKKDLDMGNMSPVVFKFKQWELVAGAGKEGVLFLLDAKSLGGADHRTPLFRSPLWTNEDVDFAGRGFWGALSTWEDPKGVRWLYAPAWGPPTPEAKFPVKYGEAPSGSIMAFRVEEHGKPALVPAWMSRDMAVPDPPIIANGIVFALSTGGNERQVDDSGRLYSSAERAKLASSGNAVLYAFDAETGRELFSSGKTIPMWTHFTGLSISSGRIYVVTHDSTVYAFTVPE